MSARGYAPITPRVAHRIETTRFSDRHFRHAGYDKACLGWNVADVARALAAASRLGASVRVVDTDETFTVAMLHAGLLEALAGVDETWRRGQMEEGRSAAAVIIATKAELARRAKIEAARPLWAKPSSEISSVEITQRVGMSLRSLQKWLGPRCKANWSGAR